MKHSSNEPPFHGGSVGKSSPASRSNFRNGSQQKPVRLILDTDMGNDIDDALALAMIHTMESAGECELLGIMSSKDNPWSAVFIDIVNCHYGRPDIPIGRVRNGVTPEDKTFISQISKARNADGSHRFPRKLDPLGNTPEAVHLLRKILAAQEDESVVVVMIGFSTNMARLLESGPDQSSSLPGLELFRRKVRFVSAMAGHFPPEDLSDSGSGISEFNIREDIPSAQCFFRACPRPIVFSGLEIGDAIRFPAAFVEQNDSEEEPHPVIEGYKIFRPMPYDRPSWDQTAVLQAVRPGFEYFDLSARGRVEIRDDGCVRFAIKPDGLHRYLILPEERISPIREEIMRLSLPSSDLSVTTPADALP